MDLSRNAENLSTWKKTFRERFPNRFLKGRDNLVLTYEEADESGGRVDRGLPLASGNPLNYPRKKLGEAISIIECGGKPNIPLFARICRRRGSPSSSSTTSDRKASGRLGAAERVLNALIAETAGEARVVVRGGRVP